MSRRFQILLVLLALLMGGWQLTFNRITPACCSPTASCCASDHESDCCKKSLELTLKKQALDPTEEGHEAPTPPSLSPQGTQIVALADGLFEPVVVTTATPLAIPRERTTTVLRF